MLREIFSLSTVGEDPSPIGLDELLTVYGFRSSLHSGQTSANDFSRSSQGPDINRIRVGILSASRGQPRAWYVTSDVKLTFVM